jgi:hypothetical protein
MFIPALSDVKFRQHIKAITVPLKGSFQSCMLGLCRVMEILIHKWWRVIFILKWWRQLWLLRRQLKRNKLGL